MCRDSNRKTSNKRFEPTVIKLRILMPAEA